MCVGVRRGRYWGVSFVPARPRKAAARGAFITDSARRSVATMLSERAACARSRMDLSRRAERREELSDGPRLQFAPSGETIILIAQAVEADRRCCRFLQFGITVEPDGGPMFWTSPDLQERETSSTPCSRCDCVRRNLRAATQNRTRRPPLTLRPSSGAHASTVQRPSTARTAHDHRQEAG